MKRVIEMLAGAAVGLLLLGACSGDADEPVASDVTVSTGAGGGDGFNEQDVAFVQGMIVHHEQAVDMAGLAADRAGSDAVRDLAARIEAAQGPEIEAMRGWLEQWAVVEPSAESMAGMDHGSAGSGDGMVGDGDMAALEEADGEAFDDMFLELMIEHHEGAVDMANVQIEEGQDPGTVGLAEAIVEAQEAEITEMRELLAAST